MEYVVKEEARKVAERELKKAKQLRHAQVRQQTVIWTEETRKRFEIEKERQIQLLASALTAQAQANVMARIEQINIEHDLAMAQVGAAQRAAAELKESQKVKELKRLKSAEIAKQRGTSALKNHRSNAEKQKEEFLLVFQRKQQVRQTEDLKAKDLVERKPFKSSNAPSACSRNTEKKHGPPEYQQSKAKALRLAPSYQGQENSKRKSPAKATKSLSPLKSRLKPKQERRKLEDQDNENKPQLRPPIGLFAKEVERRQSGDHACRSRRVKQPIDHDKPKKGQEKAVKTKVKPVVFYDSSVPKSEIKYIPPPGLVERVEKEKGTLDAWEVAEQLSKLSAQSLRNEEDLNDQREMLAKYRGEKALELERLSRELQQLTEELVVNSDGIKIPKYSLASAQLGLEDTKETRENKNVPEILPKSAENLTDTELQERKRLSSILKSFESHRSSSSSSVTEYYNPSSTEDSMSHDTSNDTETLKSKLFKALNEDLNDRLETQVNSSAVPTKISKPEDISTGKLKKAKVTDHPRELKSPTVQQTRLSSSSPTEYFSSSHSESQASSESHLPNKSLKKTDHSRTPSRELVDVQVAERPSDHESTKNLKTAGQDLAEKSLLVPINKSKESSGSTTEYYSPPHTSTPDGSKTRFSETSSFKIPLGVKEGKALRRYVTKMLHMKRESIDRLSETVSTSSSDHSKVVADSFQSEWSSFASPVQGSPASVLSKTDVSAYGSPIISGSRYLHSVTEEETEDSHPTTEYSSSPSTLANISMKITRNTTSESGTSSEKSSFKTATGTPLARPSISDSSLADKLEALSEHQLKSLSPYNLIHISDFPSSDNQRNSSVSSEDVINNYLSNSVSRKSKSSNSKSKRQQSVSSDEGTIPDLSPILQRLRGAPTEKLTSSKNIEHQKTASKRPESGGSSDKEVLRGIGDGDGNSKIWLSPQSPVYNVTDHAQLLSSVFGELRNQWANISIERPPWCS